MLIFVVSGFGIKGTNKVTIAAVKEPSVNEIGSEKAPESVQNG